MVEAEVDTRVETDPLPHGVVPTGGDVSPYCRYRRRPRGSLHLARVNTQVFAWIARCGFATRSQLTLAVRGAYRANDRYVARAIRKMYDHGYIAKLPARPFEPDIYCVSARCRRGRRVALALLGEEARIVRLPSDIGRLEVAHALGLTWLRIFIHHGCQQQGWGYVFLDHQALTQRFPRLPLVPDAAVLVQKGPQEEGERLFLLEYQRRQSAWKTTPDKLAAYRAHLPELEERLGAQRSWVILVLEQPEAWVARLAARVERGGERGTFFFGAWERVRTLPPGGFWTTPGFYLPGELGLCSLFQRRQEGGYGDEAS